MTRLRALPLAGTFLLVGFCTCIPLFSQNVATVAKFSQTTGGNPEYGPLVQGLDGNFYGTTVDGGTSTNCPGLLGCGTIFKVTPSGTITTLYNFCAQSNCVDGTTPRAGLTLGTDGNFYGTTSAGGSTYNGTIFKVTSTGQLSTLHSFCTQSNCSDGWSPVGSLAQAANGNFYGVTSAGGNSAVCPAGCGTMFQISPTGVFSTVLSFCSTQACPEGAVPRAGLTLDSTGRTLYGTTVAEGANAEGTVFKSTLTGQITTLYSFYSLLGGADGWNPVAAMLLASNGNLYGSTQSGGAFGNGTVFQISAGQFSTVYSFCPVKNGSTCADGSNPVAALTQGTDSNLYGTTWAGGSAAEGNVFQLTTSGQESSLYSFCSQASCVDGILPNAGLMQATNGSFYGLTAAAGASGCDHGCGTVYRLSMGLKPFVKAVPSSGKAGYTIKILGNGLQNTTNVTFNGTQASFTPVSSTYIKATVPASATTGFIQVTTSGGTLTSNTQFVVVH